MFIDQADMVIPTRKRSYFVAHEVLQMKPLIVKDNLYERFIEANSWVFDYFPNARLIHNFLTKLEPTRSREVQIRKKLVSSLAEENVILNLVQDLIERSFRMFQLVLINRHRTSEIITKTQLWFFPDDFEKKIPRSLTHRPNSGNHRI